MSGSKMLPPQLKLYMCATYFMVLSATGTGKHFCFLKICCFLNWTNFPLKISYHCRKVYHVSRYVVSCWYLPDLYTKSDHKAPNFTIQVG